MLGIDRRNCKLSREVLSHKVLSALALSYFVGCFRIGQNFAPVNRREFSAVYAKKQLPVLRVKAES